VAEPRVASYRLRSQSSGRLWNTLRGLAYAASARPGISASASTVAPISA